MGNWQQRAKLWLQRRWQGVQGWLQREWSKILIVAVAAVAIAALTALLWPTIQRTVGYGTDKLSRFGAGVIVASTFSVIGALVYGVAKKSLWQLLELLVIPLALTAIGLWFTMQQAAREQHFEDRRAHQAEKIENQRAEAERTLQQQRAQDEALQAYLDQMSALLLGNNLHESEDASTVRTLARARTLTVLGRLDPSRKTEVMQFLVEADLVQRVDGRDPIIELSGADLSSIDLVDANLHGAILIDADLNDARLLGADLGDANLSGAKLLGAQLTTNSSFKGAFFTEDRANLSDADLSEANLRNINLSEANLSGANMANSNLDRASLYDANLSGALLSRIFLADADLEYANLSGATLIGAVLNDADLSSAGLRGADLRFAQGCTVKQLAKAKTLEGATMPNGQKYEEWRKSKDSRKYGKYPTIPGEVGPPCPAR